MKEKTGKLKYLAVIALVAAVYCAAAKLGLALAFAAAQVSVVWPPTGIALAALLLLGYRVWPGVFLGAFLANVTTHETIMTALGIATGNTLEAFTAAWLLRRFVAFDNALGGLKDVMGLLLFSVVLSPVAAATIGNASLCLGGVQPWAAYGSLWRIWWLGDAGGALIVAPLILAWGTRSLMSGTPVSAKVIAEAFLLAGGVILSCVDIFTKTSAAGVAGYSLVYLIFPFIIWAALRFGQRGTTFVTIVATGIAVWSTAHGLGPFKSASVNQSLMLMETFMAVVASTGLFLSAAITERKTAEARLLNHAKELEHSNRELDDFVHIASHDLKEPLRGLILQATFLLEDCGDRLGAEGSQRLTRMMELSRHMGHLIDDLLHFSRLGREDGATGTADPAAIIGEISRMMTPSLAGHKARIDVAPSLPSVACDRTALAEVFRNLIVNAVKYNDKAEPRVEIGFLDRVAAPQGIEANVFFVRDNGIGIEPRFHEEIFRIFKRLPGSARYDDSGTGAGLTFVRKIIERYNGRIWLESEPGNGSTFYFTFPEPQHEGEDIP